MSYKKAIIFLIISGILIRCLIAAGIELGNDEAYYWTYSQRLQWNYFDHPPLVAILIRLTTFNLSLQKFELFVRLGGILCSGGATFFLYKTVSSLESERAGFFTALLYNSSFYGSIVAGVFILPDSPQMLFWTASLFTLSRMVKTGKPALFQWIIFGILTGLTIMSKIHGLFIWSGLFLYIIFYKKDWLRSWQMYLGGIITAAISLPILLWNWQNNFITYRYHSSRIEGIHFRADNFSREIVGQLLYNNPFVVFVTFMALSWYVRKSREVKPDFLRATILIAIPMILTFIILAMFNDTLPHWTGPAYITLLPAAGIYLSRKKNPNKIPGILKYALGLIFIVVITGILAINFYPGTLSKHKTVSTYGKGDITLDMYGWREAGIKIDSIILSDEKMDLMDNDAQFVSTKWFPAAHIDFYIARPVQKFVIGLGGMNALHHYEWLNAYRVKGKSLNEAYCVLPSDYGDNIKSLYGDKFKTIDSVTAIPIYRGNQVCRYFLLYRMKNFTGVIPKAD